LKLRDELRTHNIDLKVAYADPWDLDRRNDTCDLPTDFGIKIKPRLFFGKRLVYFPLICEIMNSNLIISEQANKHLHNYALILLSVLGFRRIAFWGLGENKDKNRSALSEWIRRRIANKVFWWFAYTEGTRRYLIENGVRDDRLTVVQNAIDTGATHRFLHDLTDQEISCKRHELGIGNDDPVGLFVGALLPDKGLDLLFKAAELAKKQLTALHIVVIGGGPERRLVEAACRKYLWMHYLGPVFGRDKILLLRIADALVLPGRVGLAILDGFAAGLPLLTTDVPYHGPELECLENMRNGMLSQHTPQAYASTMISFFSNRTLRAKLSKGAKDTALHYSVDAMVDNFSLGIRRALELDVMLSQLQVTISDAERD